MNYFDSGDKSLCCGCTACENVCPTTCINMKENYDGFLYPVIDMDRCIECGLCRKVCPLADDHSSKLSNEPQKDCYAFVASDDDVLHKSTSGGAFTTAVNGFCGSDDYAIYGVRYNEDLTLEYDYVTDKNDVSVFSGSKYFQAELGNSFAEIKNFLIQGKQVAFSGTPCHVAGLKSFLDKDYPNLLCMDLLCFGVPSKKAFSSYRQYLEKKHKDKLISYRFRNKGVSEIVAVFEGRGERRIKTSHDYFMRSFYSRKLHRECCTRCQFKRVARQGDITIGDFWGIYSISHNFDLKSGVSFIIASSEKGKLLLDKFKERGQFERFDTECAVPYNELKPHEWQVDKEIYKLIDQNIEFDKAVQKVLPLTILGRVRRAVSPLVPKGVKTFIRKITPK